MLIHLDSFGNVDAVAGSVFAIVGSRLDEEFTETKSIEFFFY